MSKQIEKLIPKRLANQTFECGDYIIDINTLEEYIITAFEQKGPSLLSHPDFNIYVTVTKNVVPASPVIYSLQTLKSHFYKKD